MIDALPVIIFLALTAIPAAGILVLLICASRSATRHVGTCRRCGYDLRSLGELRYCPECGQPFALNAEGQAIS